MIKLKVYEMMAKKGFMTRLALSKASGIHKNNLGKIVNGDVRAFRLGTLDKLCELFECQPGDLMEYVPVMKSKKRTRKK